MMKQSYWVIIMLVALIVFGLIDVNIAYCYDMQTATKNINYNYPTSKINNTETVIYSPEGKLNYRIVAQNVEYFSDESILFVTKPVLTTYDIKKIPIWSIKSDRAKLTNERIIYLCGNVEVTALTADNKLRKITTDNANINLITQEVISQDIVNLYGTTFNSSGLKMHWNLRNKNAELIENVRTYYKIKYK